MSEQPNDKPKKPPLSKEERELRQETRSILIDKLLQTYALHAKEDVADAVELYYDAQHLRITNQNRERTEGPNELVSWFHYWLQIGETVLGKKLLDWVLTVSPPESKWAYNQVGIGPIIAAGLAAHIDIEKAQTISALWKFAGQAPGFDRKKKGVKLPYNARLKTLCWKLGESFVKVCGKDDAFYGKLYIDFKAEEVRRNEAGLYAAAAKHELATKKFKKEDSVTKMRLLSGKLSDGHLHSRAKRRAVKIFLSHYWVKGREARGLPVSDPYVGPILGHTHIIRPAA
jgi:hypothetical protein